MTPGESGGVTLGHESAAPAADEGQPGTQSTRADDRGWPGRCRWVTLLVPPVVGVVFAEMLLFVSTVHTGTTGTFFSPSSWGA